MFILAIEPRRAQDHDLIQTRDAVNCTYYICFFVAPWFLTNGLDIVRTPSMFYESKSHELAKLKGKDPGGNFDPLESMRFAQINHTSYMFKDILKCTDL